MKSEKEELQLLLRSRFPILVVETTEEQRFREIVENVTNLEDIPLFTWSIVKGLAGAALGSGVVNTRELVDAVMHMVRNPRRGLYVFFDATPWLENQGVVRAFREIAYDHVLVMSNGGFGGVHEKLLERLALAHRNAA